MSSLRGPFQRRSERRKRICSPASLCEPTSRRQTAQRLFENFAGAPVGQAQRSCGGLGCALRRPNPQDLIFFPRSCTAGAGEGGGSRNFQTDSKRRKTRGVAICQGSSLGVRIAHSRHHVFASVLHGVALRWHRETRRACTGVLRNLSVLPQCNSVISVQHCIIK